MNKWKKKSEKKKELMISIIENIENEKWLDDMKSCINICFFKRWTLLFFFFANYIISIFVTRNDFIINFVIRKIAKKSNFTFAISTITRKLNIHDNNIFRLSFINIIWNWNIVFNIFLRRFAILFKFFYHFARDFVLLVWLSKLIIYFFVILT